MSLESCALSVCTLRDPVYACMRTRAHIHTAITRVPRHTPRDPVCAHTRIHAHTAITHVPQHTH